MDLDKQLDEVKASLKTVGDEIKDYAVKSNAEIEKFGTIQTETKQTVDSMLITQTELSARLTNTEQAIAKYEGEGPQSRVALSLGNQVADEEFMAELSSMSKGKIGSHVKTLDIGGRDLRATVIDSGATSGGATIEPLRVPGVTPLGQRELRIQDLFTQSPVSTNSIEFVRQTGFTNAAAPWSENPASEKPESAMTFEVASAPVVTIPHIIPATKQVLDDSSVLAGFINQQMAYGVALEEEEQILLGSGTGLDINGVVTQATAYSNPGLVPTSETVIDRLRLAILQAQLANYPVDGIVINTLDWARVETEKDGQNLYLVGNPINPIQPRLWGRPVVASNSMTVDEYLVGAFGMGGAIWRREEINIAVSTEDKDNFRKNMVTIRAESRLALTIYRPEAFITGSFNDLTSV